MNRFVGAAIKEMRLYLLVRIGFLALSSVRSGS